jgi:pimeloyl-ACP methyl ester carboxylesterase
VVENARINVVDLLPKVAVPTLVLHCEGDARIPFSLGQEIAAGIPGAKLVPLEGKNHRFLADEPAVAPATGRPSAASQCRILEGASPCA